MKKLSLLISINTSIAALSVFVSNYAFLYIHLIFLIGVLLFATIMQADILKKTNLISLLKASIFILVWGFTLPYLEMGGFYLKKPLIPKYSDLPDLSQGKFVSCNNNFIWIPNVLPTNQLVLMDKLGNIRSYNLSNEDDSTIYSFHSCKQGLFRDYIYGINRVEILMTKWGVPIRVYETW